MKKLGFVGIGIGASVALSLGLSPSASSAGVATIESVTGFIDYGDNSLVYNAHGPTNNRLTLRGDGTGGIFFADPDVAMIPITNYWFNPVAPLPLPSLRCSIGVGESHCSQGTSNVIIWGNDGNDKITVRRLPTWYKVYVTCGPGTDAVYAYHPAVSVAPDCEKVVR